MASPEHRIEIDYRKYPYSMPLFDRLLDVLEQESDEYFIMGSDDDFPLMDNLQRAFDGMRANPEVSTALGAMIHFTLKPGNEFFARLGIARPIQGSDPTVRARNFAQWPFSTTYAVTKRELLIERFKRSKEVFLPGFYDFGVGIHDVLFGKMHAIPEFTFFATRNFNHSYLRTEDPLHFIRHSEDFFRLVQFLENDLCEYGGHPQDRASRIITNLMLRQIGTVVGFPAPRLRGFEAQPVFQNAVVQKQLVNFEAIFKETGPVREAYIDQLRFIVDNLKGVAASSDNAGEAVTVPSLKSQTTDEVLAVDRSAEQSRMFQKAITPKRHVAAQRPIFPGQIEIDLESLLHIREDPSRDLHLLVLGQSNGANHGPTPKPVAFGSMTGPDRELIPLADPVFGGSGDGGSVWTRIADVLDKQRFDGGLTITLRSVGGTSVADWSSGGAQYDGLKAEIAELARIKPPITHVIWHQGERDTLLGTSRKDYIERFNALHQLVHAHMPNVTWIICRASYRFGVTSADVIAAQNAIIANNADCHPGPNTDALGTAFRYDDTHLNDIGQSEFAQMLVAMLA